MKPVIVGAGLAGLTTALSMAPIPVIVLCAGKLGEQCSSAWAQGGVAAAVGEGDTPALHAEDTLKAGAGLCDSEIVKLVTEGGAKAIDTLLTYGVPFDRNAEGVLQLGLEGAHSRRRIVHVNGDGAGHAIMQAIVKAVRATPSIEIYEQTVATNLLTEDGSITGVEILRTLEPQTIATNRVVMATGGAGALWLHTTNPLGSWGRGLALAARAGAELADLEFMQFHPTAIDIGRDPMPLASEALRGEGATLIDENGERFMAQFARAELEPRDVVSRAIWEHMRKGHKVFLDARKAIGAHFPGHFPAIYAACMSADIDPVTMPIPIRPAAHYHMGGIKVDANGRSSIEGLWACGEVASTGLNGANRLASNSLLEAAFFGARVAEDVKKYDGLPFIARERFSLPVVQKLNPQIRSIMSDFAGVLRDEMGLEQAAERLMPLALRSDQALVALLIVKSALQREESRGSHLRTDFPNTSAIAQHSIITLADVMPAAASQKRASVGF